MKNIKVKTVSFFLSGVEFSGDLIGSKTPDAQTGKNFLNFFDFFSRHVRTWRFSSRFHRSHRQLESRSARDIRALKNEDNFQGLEI